MTTRTPRTRPLPGAVVSRRVVGTPGEVAAVVATLRDANRLVGMTLPAQMPHGDGRVWVTVRIIDRPRAARTTTPPRVGRRWPVVTAVAVPATTAVAVAGYLAVQIVTALIALLPLLAGGAFVLAVLALLLRRSGVCCPGLHCPGCNH
ncbi:hypothetical protein KIF24_28880 [Micromonospora sp. Llam7]|uniref:hypothetical protein n=1 Tax=Micromonospora tarapacensis TaxID=2835305 RepID=UPI001C82BDBB|nr:hypothetical protein [Micromonospora tarapacensis]MBX7269631.1 hypothetical protein [Micromonospora tarapacensis]